MIKQTKARLMSRARQWLMMKKPVDKRINFLPLLQQPTGKG